MEFSSIISIINHFKIKNLTMDRNKIAKILNTAPSPSNPPFRGGIRGGGGRGISYKGYIFTK